MIREFFYLQKSDRKVILALLCVIVIALGVIFLTGGDNETSNALVSADSIDTLKPSKHHRDSFRRQPYHERTVYVRTKVIYRDTAYQRGHRLSDVEHDSVVAHYQPKIRKGEHVVLNIADTTALKTVPGIGPYFARKVIEYGERLGGYGSVDQLDELNVNRLSLNDLKHHPYINFFMAKAITDYRRLHGPLKSLNDLRLSKDFPQDVIDRLTPYVEF